MTHRSLRTLALASVLLASLGLQGCLVGAVAGAAVGVTGAVVGTAVGAVPTSDAEELREMRRECERRNRRGGSEDCSVYRPRDDR